MILDAENLFSDDQAVTVTAVSTNIIDQGAVSTGKGGIGKGDIPLELLVQVSEEDFAGGTSLKVQVQSDSVEAFSGPTLLHETDAILTAVLTTGYQFALARIPVTAERYLRLNYVVVGTHTAGKLTAGLVEARQTNTA